MGWLWLVCIASISLLLRALWERQHLAVTRQSIKLNHPTDAIPLADDHAMQARPLLRIVHFSDLHAEHFYIRTGQLIEQISRCQPDLIVFTGDMSGPPPSAARGVAILTHLHRHPALDSIPFYAVGGNHDVPAALELLRHHGIRVLNNQNQVITIRQARWQIVGLQDLRQGKPDLAAALKQPEAEPAVADNRRVILAHNPDTILRYPQMKSALWLSGHLHGGQIWAPFRLEYMLLRQEQLPRLGITRGLHQIGSQQIYISRGLGCVAIPLRLFSLPELAILDLMNSPEEKESVRE